MKKKLLLPIIILVLFASCQLMPAIQPDNDWIYNPPDTVVIDTIVIDTIANDTIVIDSLPPDPLVIDSCIEYTIQNEPQYVLLYIYIAEGLTGHYSFCAGNYCDSIAVDGSDMVEKVTSVMELFNPSLEYEVVGEYLDNLHIFATGTNNADLFKLKVSIRQPGQKFFLGYVTQGMLLHGAVSFEKHIELIDKYKSLARFNFLGTNWDSTKYIIAADSILGQCYGGKKWADFRFNSVPIPQFMIDKFEEAGWEKVLHN